MSTDIFPDVFRQSDYPLIHRPMIWLLFYMQNEESYQRFWNCAVQWYTNSPYIHCEFFFTLSNETVSVTSSQPVNFEFEKRYDVNTYIGYCMDVSWEQYNIIYSRCQAEIGKPFDDSARKSFIFNWLLGEQLYDQGIPEKWLCSRLMAYCLV